MICPTVSGFTGTKRGFSGLWRTNRRLLRTCPRGWHTCMCWLCSLADEPWRLNEVQFMRPHSVSYLRKLPALGKDWAASCVIFRSLKEQLLVAGKAHVMLREKYSQLFGSLRLKLSVGSLRDWVNQCNHLSITHSLAQYLSDKCAWSAYCVSPATGLAVTHFLSLCLHTQNVYH